MSLLQIFIFVYSLLSTISPLKIENDDNKIMSFTKDNNPNDIKNYLPELPKILTKVGLLCDFPFIYEDIVYKSNCALRSKDHKHICKISITKIKDKTNEEEKRINYFSSLLDSDRLLIKIKEDYFAECLEIDENENILAQFIENSEQRGKYDINIKLLKDLFSEIKQEIKKKESKTLTELFKLAENFCKSANFNFDCLYQNLIMPVSKTNSLDGLSKNIFKVIEKYKEKLKKFLENSKIVKFRFKQYQFIKNENLNFQTTNTTTARNQSDTEIEDFSNNSKGDTENLINKDLFSDIENVKLNKIFFRQFIKILISVYHICPEECKSAIDFLFIENFGNQKEKIKLEIIGSLFKMNDTAFNIDKDIFFFDDNSNKFVIFNSKEFPLNQNLQTFLDYKNWSTRYLIGVFYRYILMEKNFFNEMIKGELRQEEMNALLFLNNRISIDLPDENRIIKLIPLISPYYNFTYILEEKLNKLFSLWSLTNDRIFEEYNKTKIILKDLNHKLKGFDSHLKGEIDFFQNNLKNRIIEIIRIKKESQVKKKNLDESEKIDSTLNLIKDNSHFTNIEYITRLIYKEDFLSNECHKFLHYHSYLDEFGFGVPFVNYFSVSTTGSNFLLNIEKDIKLFYIYGIISLDSGVNDRYLIKIKTNSEIQLLLSDIMLNSEIVKKINSTENTENDQQENEYNYVLDRSIFKKSNILNLKLKGKFSGENYDDKFLNFEMEKATTEIIKSNSTSSKVKNTSFIPELDNEVQSKCLEKMSVISICFNPLIHKIECELGCKSLSKKYITKVIESNYIQASTEKFNGDKKTFYKSNFFKFNIKFNKKNFQNEEMELKKSKQIENDFISTCSNYCKVFTWSIPVYKCLYRNIKYSNFSSLLQKCSGNGNWKILGRNNKDTWFNFTDLHSKDDILLGKRNYTEVKLKPELLPYMISSIFNPLSSKSFNLPFDSSDSYHIEYMFASGDMKYFTVLDQNQIFVKAAPYNAYSKFNHRLLLKRNKNSEGNYDVSIFNLIYGTDFMSNEGIVIYDSVYGANSTVIFSNNKNLTVNNQDSSTNKILIHNKGANIFIKKQQIKDKTCLNKNWFDVNFILISNLASKEYYIEFLMATENIFAFSDLSQDLIFRMPKNLKDNSIILRTKPFQNKYSLNVNVPVKLYIGIELTDNVEKNAQMIIEDGWLSLTGTDNLIELINTDLDEELISPSKSEEKLFNFENIDKFITANKMTIFYKVFDIGQIDISYTFFDFDDLFSCRHLFLLQPLECSREHNQINDRIKLINTNATEITKDFILISEDFLPLSNISSKIKNSTKLMCGSINNSDRTEKKSIIGIGAHSDQSYFSCNDTVPNNYSSFDKLTYSNYTNPSISSNNNGCIMALDRTGNLYSKDTTGLSNWTMIKSNVKYFDISENQIIIADTLNQFAVQSNFYLDKRCNLNKDDWIYLTTNINIEPNIFVKVSLSVFNCIWIIDNKNNFYYGKADNKKLELIKLEQKINLDSDLKNIYQDESRLFILTKNDKIYIKENIYDIGNGKCQAGEVSYINCNYY